VRYLGARWLPVASHGGHMSAELGAVVHVTTNDNDPFGYFSFPGNSASSHFWISADGRVEQYVDTDAASWAQAAGNAQYVSVETSGTSGLAMTPAQLEAFAHIYAWGVQTYGWPLALAELPGERGLIWHGAGGVPWGNHPDCPGPLRVAQRGQILARAATLLPVPQDSDPGGTNMAVTAALRTGQIDTFFVDNSGSLVHRWYSTAPGGGKWDSEVLHDECEPGFPVEGPVIFNGQVHFFAPGAADTVAHIWWDFTSWSFDTQPAY
jgi:hypothetical protein